MISTSRDSTPARNATPLGTVARLRHWAALPIILAGAFMSTLDFFINAPLGVVALLLTPRVLPAVRGESRGRLDILGAALVTLGLVAVVLPLIAGPGLGWPLWTWLSLASAAPLLLTFGLTQRRLTARGGAPLLDLTLFRARAFTVGLLTELVFHAGMASFFLVLALYLQQGLGLTALASGEIFTVLALGFFATSLYAPRLVARWGRQTLAVGALVMAAGLILLRLTVADLGVGGHSALLAPALLLDGTGMGLVLAPLTATVLAGLAPRHAGAAAGVLTTIQQVAGALGVALIGLIFYGALGHDGGEAAYPQAFGAGLLYLIVLAVAVAILIQLLPRDHNRGAGAGATR